MPESFTSDDRSAVEQLGLIDDDEINLAEAAFSLSTGTTSSADLRLARERFSQLSEALRAQPVAAHDLDGQACELRRLVALKGGLTGDRETYGLPENADLAGLLLRGRGLPITLTLVYVALARALGWSAHALNTPGHALMALTRDKMIVLDPFSDGRKLSDAEVRDAAGLAPSAPITLGILAPMSNRAVLLRLLNNQAEAAKRERNFELALTAVQKMTAIAPTYSLAWWELARLYLALGDPSGAQRSLTAMLETTRDPDMASRINSALQGLASNA